MNTESQSSLSFNAQIALVIRAVRTALAWSQQDLATKANISKPTIARLESMSMSPRADTINNLLSVLRAEGVEIDILAEEVIVRFKKVAILELQNNLGLPKSTEDN
jgi:transcriptional regulator with XRE-family HTH domain